MYRRHRTTSLTFKALTTSAACACATLVLTSRPAGAEMVKNIGDACTAPTTDLGEQLVTTGTGTIGEWGASIAALPGGPIKIDLEARLLQELDGPKTAFGNATARTEFLRGVRAPLPMGLPFAAGMPGNLPQLVAGYVYNNGGSHRGHDFARSSTSDHPDPSFEVRTIADGKVIGVYFDGPPGGGGNTVIVEHTGKNGKKLYSFYMHMRNGRSHDLAAVKALDCAGNSSCEHYKTAAHQVPAAAWWGTEADAISVVPGQDVKRGQKLGVTGNTMTASGHIDASGTCDSSDCNNHLHLYLGAPTSANPKLAVEVDGFGVYGEQSSGCYKSLDDNTFFPRLFAPYDPDFVNLSFRTFTAFPEYLTGMSYRPITLSFYDRGGAFDVAGSYQYSPDTSFIVKAGDDGSGLTGFEGETTTGWIPRETRARADSHGKATFDAVIAWHEAGESTAYWHALTQAQLDARYKQYIVQNHWSLGDFFPYKIGGQQRYAVLFTTSPRSANWMTYGRSESQVLHDIAVVPAGLQVAQVVSDTGTNPPRFSMLARRSAGCPPHVYVHQQTDLGYATKAAAEKAKGYELERVQVYADGTRFNAVYGRASGKGCSAKP